jgi:Zn-dependent membrane protease YugP
MHFPAQVRERSVGAMNKNLQSGLGVLLVLVGLIWTLQGLDVLGGSVMSGVTLWAIIGPIVAIFGAWLVARAVRASRP